MLETSQNFPTSMTMHSGAATADGLLLLPWVRNTTSHLASNANTIPDVLKNSRVDWSSKHLTVRPLSDSDSTTQRLCHSLSDLSIKLLESSEISHKWLRDSLDIHSSSDSELCNTSHGQHHFPKADKLHDPNKLSVLKPDSLHVSDTDSGNVSRNDTECITKSCLKKESKTSAEEDPKPKKNVMFADSRGGDLCSIKIVKESTYEPPSNIRKFLRRATRHIKSPLFSRNNDCEERGTNGNNHSPSVPCPPPVLVWRCCFQQPASQYITFREKLERDFVSLENLVINMAQHLVHGTIKVRNLSYWKEVSLRVTTNRWTTHDDVTTIHQPSSDQHPRFDTFAFSFPLPKSVDQGDNALLNNLQPFHADAVDIFRDEVTHLELAVCYRCEAGEFWDNNSGHNYVMERRRPSLTTPEILISPCSTTSNEERRNGNGQNNGKANSSSEKGESVKSRAPQLMPYTVDMRPNFETCGPLTDYRSWQHFNDEGSYY